MLNLDHSWVNGNSAGGIGGGIANGVPLPPGPPPLIGGDVTLKHSQVKHNTAAHGGGIFNSGGTVTLQASTVTGNQVDNCEPTGPSPAARTNQRQLSARQAGPASPGLLRLGGRLNSQSITELIID